MSGLYKEVAVDPQVMAQWDCFLAIHEMFGFDKGRLLAEFPGKWRRMVMQRAKEFVAEGVNTPLSESRMIEVLKSEKFRSGLYSCGRQPDAEVGTWIEKALNQDPTFDVIVSEQTAGASVQVIPADFGFWNHSLFEANLQCRVPRSAPELINAPEKLLRKAREIRLIDQYFSPKDNVLLRELLNFLQRNEAPCKNVEVFTVANLPNFKNMDKKWREEAVKKRYQDFSTHLEEMIPNGMTVCIHFLRPLPGGENLHPRFVLADIGGLQFDYGLDEGDGTTVVSILDAAFRSQLWSEYSCETETFSIETDYPMLKLGSDA